MSTNECQCGGRIHEIINNCIKCGLIKCNKSMPGLCSFCGSPVYGKDHVDDDPFFQKLHNEELEFYELQNAINHKNKLINFEEQNIANKNIIDDETDWYEIKHNVWQNKEVRDEALERLQNIDLEDEENNKKVLLNIDMKEGVGESKNIIIQRNINKDVNKFMNNLESSNYTKNEDFNEKENKLINQIREKYKNKEKLNKEDNLKKLEKDIYYDIEFKNISIKFEKKK